MSVVLMVNEKWRERVPPWMAFTAHPLHFQGFFQELLIALTLESKVCELAYTLYIRLCGDPLLYKLSQWHFI